MGNSPEEPEILLENWKDVNGNRWRIDVIYKILEGRPMPVELRIRAVEQGYALTQSIIRALPLAGTVNQYFQVKGFRVEVDRSPRAKRVNKEYSDEELTVVANLYREAFKAHRPVQATVAQELKIPISTAAKQIAAARRRNFLGPATRRRPGEHPEVNEKVK
jgi:hypothetical protein